MAAQRKQAKPAKKAARSAAKSKAKAAKPKARKAAPKAKAKSAPRRKPNTAQVRALVARPHPGEHHPESQAEHDHHDPRLAGIPGAGPEGNKVQAENYGAFKTKAVARMDKPVNWFRRAAKPKQ